VTVIGDINCH